MTESTSNNSPSIEKPVVLAVGGSDCSGMAGIQADIRSINAMGAHAATLISAVTAQGPNAVVSANPVELSVFQDQLNALSQLRPAVVKTGMLASVEQVDLLADFLQRHAIPLVIDPLQSSSSGGELSDPATYQAMQSKLLPHADLVTPNISEAEQLSGQPIETKADIEAAAMQLRQLGARQVLIKGGHSGDSSLSQDYFCAEQWQFWLSSKRINSADTRGSGCTLASAIAAALAKGYTMEDAVVIGKMVINQGLRKSYAIAGAEQGSLVNGPIAPSHFPNVQSDMPLLTRSSELDIAQSAFPESGPAPLGLYPVVDHADWLERLIPQGVTTIQLRVKDLSGDALENEIIRAIAIARRSDCRLFINDYWQLAIKHRAYGVHLGQEDLDGADLPAIRAAGIRLGVSTHCHYEVARALACKPSYIACGPVYHTNIKQMPWVPQGLAGLRYWQQCLSYPLVAIGGINVERLDRVAEIGVDGIAMISAITLAGDPEATARALVARLS